MNDLVSIITPCYNSEKFIAETIKSVQNQTHINWEMLIVDDFSSDNSVKIIEKLLIKDNRIKLFKELKNNGAAKCRNKAITNANGRYIAFLDSDDLWMTQKLEKQIAFMQKNKYSLTYTAYKKINESGEIIKEIVSCKEKLNYKTMLRSNKIGCLTVIYDVKMLGKVFMPNIRKRQDFALWLRILKKTPYIYGLNIVLASYRLREGSISSNKFELLKWNWILYFKIEKLSFLKSTYYLINNIFNKVYR